MTAQPIETMFVLVHGAWHSSWHWVPTQRALAARGVASVAVDLPGHGFDAPLPTGYLTGGRDAMRTEKSALAGLTMQDCADAVLSTLRSVRGGARSVVLVAHSAGGGPASLAAEQAPELVDRIVYLSAFVPAGRPSFLDYANSPENTLDRGPGLTIGDPGALGAIRLDPLSTELSYVDELHQTYHADLPVERVDRWRSTLSTDLPLAVPSSPISLTGNGWGSIPRTFVRCADDRAFLPAAQDLMIAEADEAMPARPFTVHTLPGDHSPFLARPDELAAVLASPPR
ncbi:pimeloyl-ACP methyl ester carboxylesterase [Actinoalloteichus hoggarensis]|uniref:Pyrethroid hydrolase n=1 Tax=Actinoalloteichus hoggarensis TaxID=1470176 RepID=A0A221W4P9_9PSEU|nr:alpha/beta fold hydrolase [Actinoalloteichus hoggarensis]ASO20744.1 Pyrethroid hydrolase [Actinoalloteichus hoggarensis]MBB5920674.1 pimeloyl-ACP methyl ester carboxylesterase [Actinoalloteichus hoggarensis]